MNKTSLCIQLLIFSEHFSREIDLKTNSVRNGEKYFMLFLLSHQVLCMMY